MRVVTLADTRSVLGATPRLALCEDQLHAAACRATGLDDFGSLQYREGLRALLHAFDTDLQLTNTGWRIAYERILRTLIARLYAQKGWMEHPGVVRAQIRRPLVIIGLPRTGTTALHRLLAADPQFQGLQTWLAESPMVRPPPETWQTHSAYRACLANLRARYARTPEVRTAHEVVAGEVAECGMVLMQSFASNVWTLGFGLSTYGRWLPAQNVRESYRYYVDVLRLIGAREPRTRWLLKCPSHMADIDALLEVYPDACIVHTHRDPLKAIPSFCSLRYMVQRDFEGEAARPDAIGPQQATYWRMALDRVHTVRRALPAQFFDVEHRRFLVDPLGVVRSIYDHFGVMLTARTEQHMREWVAAKPTSVHGRHEYPVDSWGVTQTQLAEIFADYRMQHQFD